MGGGGGKKIKKGKDRDTVDGKRDGGKEREKGEGEGWCCQTHLDQTHPSEGQVPKSKNIELHKNSILITILFK